MTEETGKPGKREKGADPLAGATEEALKLFETLQRRAAKELGRSLLRGTVSGLGDAFSGGDRGTRDVWEEAVSEHEEYVCRACPVCRAVAAQRESGGTVAEHLTQAGSELLAAFTSIVDGLNRPSPSRRARERDRPESPAERVDLGEPGGRGEDG